MSPSARSVASPRVVSIADLRAIAQRRVPASVFDYLDGGAEGEVTLRENCRVYEDVTFRPRPSATAASCTPSAKSAQRAPLATQAPPTFSPPSPATSLKT